MVVAASKYTAYRLRMICGQWYVQYFKKDKHVANSNPMKYEEALEVAKASGLPDYDRG